MWEVGVNGGYFFIVGDVFFKFGYVYGVYVRKVIDYIFFLWVDFLMGWVKGENVVRMYIMDWFFGMGWGVLSLNNFCFDKVVRNFNYYIMGGVGVNFFKFDFFNENIF